MEARPRPDVGATPTTIGAPPRLEPEEWRRQQAAHEQRVEVWLQPHLARRRAGQPHPVEDFLFTYYSYRPAQLRRWHPGHGTVLLGADELLAVRGHGAVDGGVAVTDAFVREQRPLLEQLHTLLEATLRRPPAFGCFGMHEWAMLYRTSPEEVRHAAWPLRLGHEGTDAVVESHRIRCSHFDAYRFFTDAARPRNTLRPGPRDRAALEQPGCLHAGMDLYKVAYRLAPMVPSELVADCFALAREIRTLDMRASPYDLRGLGYAPVRVETAAGKQEYAAAQRAFTERAQPLRRALRDWCVRLLGI